MDAILVLGHGANNTMEHPLIAGVHERLAREGVVTVRFNFPYAEEGKKRPDPEPVLEGAFRLMVEYVAEMEEFRTALISQMQDNLTALALAVARQLMEREVKAEPAVVANLVRSALSHFPLDQKLRIRLNPLDLSSISMEQSGNQAPVSAGREVRWVTDETLGRGSCVVEGPERIVDGRVEAALERIYRMVCNG